MQMNFWCHDFAYAQNFFLYNFKRNFLQCIERKPLCDLLHFVSWKKIVASTSNNNNLRVYDRFLGVGGIHGAP